MYNKPYYKKYQNRMIKLSQNQPESLIIVYSLAYKG